MGKVILAIDDEEHILELLAYNLENNGFKVLTASSGEDGLEIIKKENIDLILLDIMLPGIDGMEMLKRTGKNSIICCTIIPYSVNMFCDCRSAFFDGWLLFEGDS